MEIKYKKFDTHSHIGVDARHPFISNIEDYVRNAKQNGINRSLLIGVPLPVYPKEGGIFTPLNWNLSGINFVIASEFVDSDGNLIRGNVEENPFAESNSLLETQVKNNSSTDLKLDFVPHVHPLLDTEMHLNETLEKKPLAVKVHGSSWGINPKDISPSFFQTLKKYNVPLIVHTDYNQDPQNGRHLIQKMNDPLVWIDLCQRYGVRASLAHGLRLCQESWKKVSKSGGQFIVGFGPKLDTKQSHRVKTTGVDYTPALLGMADLSKLTYDVDFAWNTESYDFLDWTLGDELIGKVSEDELMAVYAGNARRFYGGID